MLFLYNNSYTLFHYTLLSDASQSNFRYRQQFGPITHAVQSFYSKATICWCWHIFLMEHVILSVSLQSINNKNNKMSFRVPTVFETKKIKCAIKSLKLFSVKHT